MTQAVVADASPLIALSRIGEFRLLPRYFTPLYIPPAVYRDVVVRGAGRPGAAEVETGLQTGWLRQQAPEHLVAPPWGQMHTGEVEALSLAVELGLAVLMDEGPGRRRAAQESLLIVGTVDILLVAKREGDVSAVRPYLDALLKAQFRLSATLYQEALKKAGEDKP